MSTYTQYSGNNSQTSMAQRLLNNGSDYFCVRTGEYQYLFIQGHCDLNHNSLAYTGETWLYNSRDNILTYDDQDSGTVALVNTAQVYGSLPEIQSLSVADVWPKWIFFSLFALILVLIGFNAIKKRWIV